MVQNFGEKIGKNVTILAIYIATWIGNDWVWGKPVNLQKYKVEILTFLKKYIYFYNIILSFPAHSIDFHVPIFFECNEEALTSHGVRKSRSFTYVQWKVPECEFAM